MSDYCTIDELADWNGDPRYAGEDAWRYQVAVGAASRAIDAWCGRRFYADDTATARVYVVGSSTAVLRVDDFYTTSGLAVAVDSAGDGTYGTAWTLTTDYRLLSTNDAWLSPSVYSRIAPTGARAWPVSAYGLPTVQVTAKWGWADVPDAVRQAALILASKLVKLKDAPLGVAGFGDFGAVRVQGNRDVEMLLAPLRRMDRVGGIA